MSEPGRAGGGTFDATQRRAIARTLREGRASACPVCAVSLVRHAIEPPPDVSYVRHRALLVCPQCHRSGGFDVGPGPIGT